MDKGTWAGIIKFILIGLVFVGGLYLLGGIFSMPAQAKLNYALPEPPYAFFGLELEKGDSFCVNQQREWQKNWVSNGGLGQKVWKSNRWSVDFLYRHHSCAFLQDANSYDAIGFQIIYSPWAKR